MLYKFRSWDNDDHKKLLKNREIFFSSIKWFNDPFDSNIPINYEDLSEDEQRELITEHVENDHPKLSGWKKERKIDEYLEAAAFNDPEKLKENYEKAVKPQNEEEFGVLSLAGNKKSILMWSHYSRSHTGFCVGFDEKRLKTYANNFGDEHEFIIMHPIEYEEEYPDFNPLKMDNVEYAIKPLLVKSSSWCYEDEMRLVYVNGADEKLILPEELFSEVTLGCEISEETKNSIIEIINSNFNNLPIYQAKLADREFELVFEKI